MRSGSFFRNIFAKVTANRSAQDLDGKSTPGASDSQLPPLRSRTGKSMPPRQSPRMVLSYPVTKGGVTRHLSLPLVIGVLSDLSGDNKQPLAPVEDRQFLDIDRNTFDDCMLQMMPRATFRVPNVMNGARDDLSIDLTFETMVDFAPAGVAGQVELLRPMLEAGAPDPHLTETLNLILHHERFQQLDSAWRGLHYLVFNTETGSDLKIRILDISKADLSHMSNSSKDDTWQSPLFRKIYSQAYGQLGGEPFGCLIADYYFDHTTDDVQVLGYIAQIAAAAQTPIISGVSAGLFGAASWQAVSSQIDPLKILDAPDYMGWQALRNLDGAQYIGLALPRILGRLPYGSSGTPVENFAFEETIAADTPSSFLWINSAYGMASNVTRSFRTYGHCHSIRGLESGGVLENLPHFAFTSDSQDTPFPRSAEVTTTDRREEAFAKCGLMSLLQRQNANIAYFIGAQSLRRPDFHEDPDARAMAAVAARLPYVFDGAVIAQYLMVLARDFNDTFADRAAAERMMNEWLANWVLEDYGSASDEQRVRRPLQDAVIEIDPTNTDGVSFGTLTLVGGYLIYGAKIRVRVRFPVAFPIDLSKN
jgi:type VI secretion system protein ImpC